MDNTRNNRNHSNTPIDENLHQNYSQNSAVGIIAEFNPFHNGHKRLIHAAKERTGADFVVIIMSGDFVQRGMPAILEQKHRAKMALSEGADLVLSLPVRYSTGSAPVFAKGAIAALEQLPCVEKLMFGAENELQKLSCIAFLEATLEQSSDYEKRLKEKASSGKPYPYLRAELLLEEFKKDNTDMQLNHEDLKQILHSPNCTLGIEYLKALKHFQSPITPFSMKRNDNGYHDKSIGEYCSATSLRLLLEQGLLPSQGLPASATELMSGLLNHSFPITAKDFSLLLYDRLLTHSKAQLMSYQDIDKDSALRMSRLVREYQDYEDFSECFSQKQKTRSRTDRMLSHVLLSIPQFYPQFNSQASADWIPYLRVLGMKKEASRLLSSAKVPVITNLAESQKYFHEQLPELLKEDLYAESIYRQAIRNRYQQRLPNAFREGPVWMK